MNETSKPVARPSVVSAPRILVVEDEIDVALLISYNLEAEGYVVESVARGDEAELRLAENAPDLVILDWVLPGVSGIEICRRLRARGDPHIADHHGHCPARGIGASARSRSRRG
jgi:two-component system, OmpR family, phosphate regulon response regulator PhoB